MPDDKDWWCDPGFLRNAPGFFSGEVDFSQVLGRRAPQEFPGEAFTPQPRDGSGLVHYAAGAAIDVTGTGQPFSASCVARCTPGQPARFLQHGVGNVAFEQAVIAYRRKHGF